MFKHVRHGNRIVITGRLQGAQRGEAGAQAGFKIGKINDIEFFLAARQNRLNRCVMTPQIRAAQCSDS